MSAECGVRSAESQAAAETARQADAALHMWEFKCDAMRAMFCAILRVAIDAGTVGYFSANDLPVHGEREHGGRGIAGSVMRQLVGDGILAPVGVWDGDTFVPRTTGNAGGNRIGLYRLAKPSLARTLLERHAPRGIAEKQQEFALSAQEARP